jgi:DNA-binding transcriptional LysR family regulator
MAAKRRRRVDIVFTHGLENAALCRSEIVAHERLFVLLPVGHPLTERPAVTWADLADMCLMVPVGSPQDPVLLEKIASDGGPTIQICRASEATVILKVQLGQGVTLAGEGFARTVAIDATVWKPISGQSSTSSIKAVWLESNPKRALLRLVGTASNMVTATS